MRRGFWFAKFYGMMRSCRIGAYDQVASVSILATLNPP